MTGYLVEELSRYVENRQAILIAGAGITISATGDPVNCSWQGLLRLGLERCKEIHASLAPDWITDVESKIASTNIAILIEGAQAIQSCLQSKPGGHFRKWLATTVGSLSAKNSGILRAIADLEIPIATTNYDNLLLEEIGGKAITWRDPAAIQRVVRGEEQGVIHLHGHWQDQTSVVLGVSSYAEAMGDRQSQEIVKSLFASHSVIFAGFGLGLNDPNFSGLRKWAREILNESDFPPSVLVRKCDVKDAEDIYGVDGFQVIAYGDSYDDLEIFLTSLKPRKPHTTTEITYDWPSLQIKLARLNRRIKRNWDPEIVISMSGAGNFAPNYCMSLDTTETSVINAVTFPKILGRSPKNLWFTAIAESSGWKHFESTKWDVFIPEIVSKLPTGTRILIFDDRVIGGNIQRRVADWLTTEFGHEVRRAALVVHPDTKDSVDWYEDVLDINFYFPWGGRLGRA
mgnify:CR=1 FL=1